MTIEKFCAYLRREVKNSQPPCTTDKRMTVEKFCAYLRREVKNSLPTDANIMRDRLDGLYVFYSDTVPEIEGYKAVRRGKLVCLYPESAILFKADELLESNELAETLTRFKGSSDFSIKLFSSIVKAHEANDKNALEACEKQLRQAAAAAMRQGGGEGLYYCAKAI